jgi:hypothetical protein
MPAVESLRSRPVGVAERFSTSSLPLLAGIFEFGDAISLSNKVIQVRQNESWNYSSLWSFEDQ